MAEQRRTKKWWREQFVATHYAALNRAGILSELMTFRGYDTVSLARAVTSERMRLGSSKGVSPQMIGQLRNGRVTQCSPDLAQAIESVLQVPTGVVFTVREKPSHRQLKAKADAA